MKLTKIQIIIVVFGGVLTVISLFNVQQQVDRLGLGFPIPWVLVRERIGTDGDHQMFIRVKFVFGIVNWFFYSVLAAIYYQYLEPDSSDE